MDSLGGSNLSAFASSDPKTAVMRQIQQEAAVQNARMLVEVNGLLESLFSNRRAFWLLGPNHGHLKNLILVLPLVKAATNRFFLCRNSMSIALSAVSPSPATLSQRAKNHASQRAWRNI